mmetsp:Transcript_93252/g.263271  ORF Transcript_93252/g.263271 Transcript_93252/m.263271 type:complete len:224 (+) Transcript_93252:380-1051(+)
MPRSRALTALIWTCRSSPRRTAAIAALSSPFRRVDVALWITSRSWDGSSLRSCGTDAHRLRRRQERGSGTCGAQLGGLLPSICIFSDAGGSRGSLLTGSYQRLILVFRHMLSSSARSASKGPACGGFGGPRSLPRSSKLHPPSLMSVEWGARVGTVRRIPAPCEETVDLPTAVVTQTERGAEATPHDALDASWPPNLGCCRGFPRISSPHPVVFTRPQRRQRN